MQNLTQALKQNLDLVALGVALAVTYLFVFLYRRKVEKKLDEEMSIAEAATQEAAHARLTALTGLGDDGPPQPADVPVSPGAAGPAAGSASADQPAVLTQYTAGDGQGVAEIEKMLEKDPENLQLLDWLAFMYYSNNDTENAISTYARIIAIDPDNAGQHYYLANSYYKANRIDEALSHWRKVVELKPDGKLGKKARDRLKKVESAVG